MQNMSHQCQNGMMKGCGCGNKTLARCLFSVVVLAIACCIAFKLGELKGLMVYGQGMRGTWSQNYPMRNGRQMMPVNEEDGQRMMMPQQPNGLMMTSGTNANPGMMNK